MCRIIRLELNRNLTILGIWIFLIFLFFAVSILQLGILKFNDESKHQEEFLNEEVMKVERYVNYHQYAIQGFKRLLESSPLFSLVFNSTTLDDLSAFIDNSVSLKLGKNEKGKGLFDRATGGTLDFSWFILFFGGIALTLWGYFSFRNKEYLRFLMNFASIRIVYWGVILGRIILIIFFLSIIMFVAFVQFLINGIKLTFVEISGLFVFLLLALLVAITLMVVSAGFGALKNWIKGVIFTGAFFFVFVFLWPEVLCLIFSRIASANMQSAYKLNIQKVELVMKFERESYDYVNKFETKSDRIEADKFMGEKFWNKDFKNIEKREDEMIEATRKNAKRFHFCCIFNPVTFYKSTNNELSSKGFNSYIDFYQDGQKKQKGFLRFFLDKKSYKPYTKVEPYLSKEEMVFDSEVSLPFYFGIGLIIGLLYIVGVFLFSFYREKKFLFPAIQDKTEKLDIQFKKGEDTLIIIDEPSADLLSNVMNGEVDVDHFDGKITVNGKSIVTNKKDDHSYFPILQELPGNLSASSLAALAKIPAGDIAGKRLKDIDFEDKFRLMLNIARSIKSEIYVFHLAIPLENYELIREIKEELKSFSKDAAVVYYCSESFAPLGGLKADHTKIMINTDGVFKYKDVFKFDDPD